MMAFGWGCADLQGARESSSGTATCCFGPEIRRGNYGEGVPSRCIITICCTLAAYMSLMSTAWHLHYYIPGRPISNLRTRILRILVAVAVRDRETVEQGKFGIRRQLLRSGFLHHLLDDRHMLVQPIERSRNHVIAFLHVPFRPKEVRRNDELMFTDRVKLTVDVLFVGE